VKARQSYNRVAETAETINENPVDSRALGREYWLDFVADLIRLSSVSPQIATSNIGSWISTPFKKGVVDELAALALCFGSLPAISIVSSARLTHSQGQKQGQRSHYCIGALTTPRRKELKEGGK
jgi:hypothetical protein